MSAAIALNRFGLGARPDEPPPDDPQRWLVDQFARFETRPAAWSDQADGRTIGRAYANQREQLKTMPADDAARKDARQAMRQDDRQIYVAAANARFASALTATAPFIERLIHFWANHFAVSADKAAAMPFIGAFELDAIRPYVLGRFEDMLLAVERHPAMLLYLDQAQSIGPGSRAGVNAAMRNPGKKVGLNENLAREILELHTLGVRSGYGQADVTEFARALTGWSIADIGRGGGPAASAADPGSFVFRPGIHQPGTRTLLRKSYPQSGEDQAAAILHDLATAQATAHHIATKLARHFVADDPPAALVGRLETAFLHSGGDLPTVYRALIAAPEAWVPDARKFKTPWEWLVSASRGIGMRQTGEIQTAGLMQQLGQPMWRPGNPAGYDDVAASWAAPDALLRRVEVAQRIAMRVGDRLDPRTLAPKLLPGAVDPDLARQIAAAESPVTGLVLLLISPGFQRR